MRYRVSPSKLESFRLFRDTEWMTAERLTKQLLAPFENTMDTCIGNAVHKYIEKGEAARPEWWDAPVEPDIIEVPQKLDGKWVGFRVLKKSVDDVMTGLGEVQIHEVKDINDELRTRSGDVVSVAAKADGATGQKLWEWKTKANTGKSKQLNMLDYTESIQGPMTMWVMEAPMMEFVGFHLLLDKKRNAWWVKNSGRTGDLYWSDRMMDEIMDLVEMCINFHKVNDLEYLLLPWEDHEVCPEGHKFNQMKEASCPECADGDE